MKMGRNDPCPCGSGKKYKKCCMEKDEAAARAQRAALTSSVTAPAPAKQASAPKSEFEPEPENPIYRAADARWTAFEQANYEEQLALFSQTLDEPELMDGEMAFSMLDQIFRNTAAHNERHRFDALVEQLRQRYPEVYREEANSLLGWQFQNALAEGRLEQVRSLLLEYVPLADTTIDTFHRVLDQLAFHGHLDLLAEVTARAWPVVKNSKEIMPWGIDEFALLASHYQIFQYVEQCARVRADDPELHKRLAPYPGVDQEKLAPYLAFLTGQEKRRWNMSDLDFKAVAQPVGGAPRRRNAWHDDEEEECPKVDPEEQRRSQNLYDLSIEFLGHLRREAGSPLPRGEQGRRELVEYLLERANADLGPRLNMLDQALPANKRRKVSPTPAPAHMLCPDSATMDVYLGMQMDFLSPQPYKVTALLTIIPAWLRFLELRGLIDAALHERTLNNLREIAVQAHTLNEQHYRADPLLAASIAHWPE